MPLRWFVMPIQLAIAVLFIRSALGFAGTDADSPFQTNICELVKSPRAFNGQLVSIRAPVLIAFENFELSVAGCADRSLDYIWLEYGSGPKRQPTTWCCGDMVPRDALPLTQDAEFRRFHRFLTAARKAKGCYDCYLYHVTATIDGRFDAVETQPCPGDAESRCCAAGFGHLGKACARIVIRDVSSVVATPMPGLSQVSPHP